MSNPKNGRISINIIMVIVILGILAAVALPHYLEQQHKARRYKVQAWASALRSGLAIAHAAAQVYGQTGTTGNVILENEAVSLVNGYPDVGIRPEDSSILVAAKIGTKDAGMELSADGATLTLAVADDHTPRANCHASYTEATSPETPPTIVVVLGGC
jgi:MSHA pilin protein MshA